MEPFKVEIDVDPCGCAAIIESRTTVGRDDDDFGVYASLDEAREVCARRDYNITKINYL